MYSLIQSNIYVYDLPALSRVCNLFWEVLQHVRRIPRGAAGFCMADTGSKTVKAAFEVKMNDQDAIIHIQSMFSRFFLSQVNKKPVESARSNVISLISRLNHTNVSQRLAMFTASTLDSQNVTYFTTLRKRILRIQTFPPLAFHVSYSMCNWSQDIQGQQPYQ